jgi:dsDNA-specific endonuclease/ATPase MutS2
MEPKPAIALNNNTANMAQAEIDEERAVLAALSDQLVDIADEIYRAVGALTSLDLASARARHAKCVPLVKTYPW